jgi:NADH-quinone oxidoreductase subunit J
MSFAEFLAVTQILIYAGGVVVVILFGIMLTSKTSGTALTVKNTNVFSAALLGCLLIYLLIRLLTKDFSNAQTEPLDFNSIRETGINLMTSHLLAFEVAAILLLVTLIGAAVISSGNKNSIVK